MVYKKKSDFTWVRSIYGKGADAKAQYEHIPDHGMNAVVKAWQEKQVDHPRDVASPSTILMCPRVIWLLNKGVEPTNEMTWAVKQRLLLGRLFENQFAEILADEGMLLKHWKDDPGMEVEKFKMGDGDTRNQGVPDYILKMPYQGQEIVAVSDAKTSRSDSFGYVPLDDTEIFTDWGWYKYRIQLTNYWLLCHKNKAWFEANNIPLPTHCHLFSYALDDGIVRRDVVWQPTKTDVQTVLDMTERFNRAVVSKTMPFCTCSQSFDNFDVKFCKFGEVAQGSKIAETCCSESLESLIKE